MEFIFSPKQQWGTKLWEFIHTVTINSHPEKVSHDEERNKSHKQQALDITISNNNLLIKILKAIKDVIPCPKCLETYSAHLEYLDAIDTTEQMILFKWSFDLHNAVNIKLNKPTYTYEQALEIWTNKDYRYAEFNKTK